MDDRRQDDRRQDDRRGRYYPEERSSGGFYIGNQPDLAYTERRKEWDRIRENSKKWENEQHTQELITKIRADVVANFGIGGPHANLAPASPIVSTANASLNALNSPKPIANSLALTGGITDDSLLKQMLTTMNGINARLETIEKVKPRAKPRPKRVVEPESYDDDETDEEYVQPVRKRRKTVKQGDGPIPAEPGPSLLKRKREDTDDTATRRERKRLYILDKVGDRKGWQKRLWDLLDAHELEFDLVDVTAANKVQLINDLVDEMVK